MDIRTVYWRLGDSRYDASHTPPNTPFPSSVRAGGGKPIPYSVNDGGEDKEPRAVNRRIRKVLEREGLPGRWNGRADTRIAVVMEWKRRR
jgi:hypothetical protein